MRLFKIGIAKEVALIRVIKALTLKRLANALINFISFLLSAILKRPILFGYPSIVNIEPTNLCNLQCPLCITGSGQMKRAYGRVDFEHYCRLIDQIAERTLYLTLYHQGEPYLHKQFDEMVAYAKSKGLYVTTSTNGHFFHGEAAERVVRSGLDSMIMSLDGVTQDSYARYRINGELDRVLTGIRNLVAAKSKLHSKTPYIFLQFLVMKHNEHEIPQIKKLALELGVDRLLIKTTQVMTMAEADEWLPKDERYRRYQIHDDALQVKQGKGICPRIWLTTLVDWDGQVVPCCFDKNGEYPFGNINSEAFANIWNNKSYTAFRRQMLVDRSAIDICRLCNYGIGLFK